MKNKHMRYNIGIFILSIRLLRNTTIFFVNNIYFSKLLNMPTLTPLKQTEMIMNTASRCPGRQENGIYTGRGSLPGSMERIWLICVSFSTTYTLLLQYILFSL